MRNDVKSIAYAFISEGVQIYLAEQSDNFLISKLVCLECGWSWYMNLTECFICGSVNSFLYQCLNCGNFQSITNSTGTCNTCQSNNLLMICANKNCLSNTDSGVFNEIKKFGGVFNKNSGFLISQQYCLNCGSQCHQYLTYRIYVKVFQSKSVTLSRLDITPQGNSFNSYLLLKWKGGQIKYHLIKTTDITSQTIDEEEMTDHFKDIVNRLYPNKTY